MNTLELDQRLGLLTDPDFIDWATREGKTPQEALDLPEVLSRALRCVRPVFLDRLDTATGSTEEMRLPCGTANAHKCPSCAEFSQRLRQRQIIRGFESAPASATRVAMLTNTAPSFGRVHRVVITPKDEWKVRHLYGAKKEAALLLAAKQKEPCACKALHRWDEAIAGTPITPATYNYAQEVIWSENLPALLKSMTRRLRYSARSVGVPDEDMGLFTVFERQRRGSLHTHTLIVVRGHNAAFDALMKTIRTGWADHLPTAAIPPERVKWYRSPVVAARWTQFGARTFLNKDGMPRPFDVSRALPRARWKGSGLVPATTFGKNFDLTEVAADRNLEGEQDGQNGFQQAAGYVSKYLTKNQQASSLEALKEMKGPKRLHFSRMRIAAGCLTLDRLTVEATIRAAERLLKELEQERAAILEADYTPETAADVVAALEAIAPEIAEARADLAAALADFENPARSPIIDRLFTGGADFMPVSESSVSRAALVPAEARAARGMSIRINRALDNAGFTGSLTAVSQWGCSLADLKREMAAHMEQQHGPAPETHYEYELNPVRMAEVAMMRTRLDLDLSPPVPAGTVPEKRGLALPEFRRNMVKVEPREWGDLTPPGWNPDRLSWKVIDGETRLLIDGELFNN